MVRFWQAWAIHAAWAIRSGNAELVQMLARLALGVALATGLRLG